MSTCMTCEEDYAGTGTNDGHGICADCLDAEYPPDCEDCGEPAELRDRGAELCRPCADERGREDRALARLDAELEGDYIP